MKRLKILYITYEYPYFPGGSGGQTRQYFMLRELSQRHDFHYVGPYVEGKRLVILQDLFQSVMMPKKREILDFVMSFALRKFDFGYPSLVQRFLWAEKVLLPLVKNALMQTKYDIIQIEHTIAAHWLHGLTINIPTVLVAHNIKTVMYERCYQSSSGWKRKKDYIDFVRFKNYESTYFKDFDCIVTVSNVDKKLVNELCDNKKNMFVVTVPNGVDLEHFTPQPGARPDTLVYTGTMNYPPNHEAILFFHKYIFPKILLKYPHATLNIVGNSPRPGIKRLHNNMSVKITGFVPDIRPHIAAAAIVIVPLLTGSGTRLKILEAMSMGKAIISTSVGAEGIEYSNGENILIADDPDEFAAAVIELLSDHQKRIHMGLEARKLVEMQYSWKKSAETMEEVYNALL